MGQGSQGVNGRKSGSGIKGSKRTRKWVRDQREQTDKKMGQGSKGVKG